MGSYVGGLVGGQVCCNGNRGGSPFTQFGVRVLSPEDYPYDLEAVLGQGVHGTCYLARGPDQRDYCVKAIDLAKAGMPAVKKEAHMLEQCRHPCITGFLGIFFQGNLACFVQDRYPGGNVLDASQRHHGEVGALSIPAIKNVMRMAVLASNWLHEHLIVHRDLKAANFLLNQSQISDPRCQVFLCDFGTACRVAVGQRLRAASGTPTHWAPELFRRDYGIVVDSWALGVMAYQLIWQEFPDRPMNLADPDPAACSDPSLQPGEVSGLPTEITADTTVSHLSVVGDRLAVPVEGMHSAATDASAAKGMLPKDSSFTVTSAQAQRARMGRAAMEAIAESQTPSETDLGSPTRRSSFRRGSATTVRTEQGEELVTMREWIESMMEEREEQRLTTLEALEDAFLATTTSGAELVATMPNRLGGSIRAASDGVSKQETCGHCRDDGLVLQKANFAHMTMTSNTASE